MPVRLIARQLVVVNKHDAMLEEPPDQDPVRRAGRVRCRCERPMIVRGDDLGIRCYRCGKPPRL